MNIEQKLMMSPTLERLFHLSQGMPTDVHNPNDLKEAFSTCAVELMDALDNNRIHFDKVEDKAIFYGLLAVVMDVAMGGRLKTAFTQATVN